MFCILFWGSCSRYICLIFASMHKLYLIFRTTSTLPPRRSESRRRSSPATRVRRPRVMPRPPRPRRSRASPLQWQSRRRRRRRPTAPLPSGRTTTPPRGRPPPPQQGLNKSIELIVARKIFRLSLLLLLVGDLQMYKSTIVRYVV